MGNTDLYQINSYKEILELQLKYHWNVFTLN